VTDEPSPSELEAHVDAVAKLVALPIAPAYRPGVVLYLGVIAAAAAQVMAFPLPDEVEPAPVFGPAPSEP
jgi:Protein of unknown function (DUF4089)